MLDGVIDEFIEQLIMSIQGNDTTYSDTNSDDQI